MNFSNFCKFILLGFLFIAKSQQLLVLENADEIIGSENQNYKIRELKGNVKLSQGDLKIKCEKAIQNLTKNEVDLFGNVRITKQKLIINSSSAHYKVNNKVCFFKDGIELFRNKFHVVANTGVYYSDENLADFTGNVKANDSVSIITCNKLEYLELDEKAIATEKVMVKNFENTMFVKSEKMEHFEATQFSRFTINPVFLQIDSTDDGEIDSLAVSGNTIEVFNDSTQTMNTKGNVKLAKNNLSAICEDLKFEQLNEKITFIKKPWLWFENSQISGDTIIAFIENRNLENLEIQQKAFMLTQSNKNIEDRFDQLSGKNINMKFQNKQLQNISITGNATSLYYIIEDDKSKGANKTSGDKIDLYFVDGTLESISIKSGIEGKYFPDKTIKQNPNEVNLEGFKFLTDKPTIKSILTEKNFAK